MPAYQAGVGMCGSVNRMWSVGVTPVPKIIRNTIRSTITNTASIR